MYAADVPIKVLGNNLHVCTSDPCTLSAPSGTGNLIVEGVVKFADGTTQNSSSPWITSGNNIYTGNSGNVGIGTTGPAQKLDINGAIKIGTTATTCDATTRGTMRYVAAAADAADAIEFCLKNGNNTYTWQHETEAYSCGSSMTVTHTQGVVAPVTKTVTYGTVNSSLTGSAKCWITKNLGATDQATVVTDSTEPSAGWYWQFNRAQGRQYTTSVSPAWTITAISEDLNWASANDPCALLLGTGWRLPTSTEWTSADANGPWASYTDTFASVLKLHAAGYLGTAAGALTSRGVYGLYWSSTQSSVTTGWYLDFASGSSVMGSATKAYGFTARCLRD